MKGDQPSHITNPDGRPIQPRELAAKAATDQVSAGRWHDADTSMCWERQR
jgi:hypothetical protein